MSRDGRSNEQIVSEGKMLLESGVLKDAISRMRERAITDMLRSKLPAEMSEKRDLVTAIDSLMPMIQGMVLDAENTKRQDAATDAA